MKTKLQTRYSRNHIWLCSILLLFLLGLTSGSAFAQFAGGDGSEDQPYKITTLEQLDDVRNHTSSHFVLINDIDASETATWNDGDGFPSIAVFSGTFDGKGYVIDGLENNANGYRGLFNQLTSTAVIKNLGITNVTISGTGSSAGILAASNYGTVENCYSTGTVGQNSSVGGLIGRNESTGLIRNSYSRADVTIIFAISAAWNAGGGGLTGRNSGTIRNSYSTGEMSHSGTVFTLPPGGFIGGMGTSYTLGNNFWDTETSGMATSVPDFPQTTDDITEYAGITGKTTAEMTTAATFTDTNTEGLDQVWDFDTIWAINPSVNDGYPYLRSPANVAPVVTNVSISGTMEGGEELTASYDYYDQESVDSDQSSFQWYRSDDAEGTNKTAIDGATNTTYTLTSNDGGKYISLQVTPNDGEDSGTPVESNFLGPVSTSFSFAGGDGSELNPYQVSTLEQLQAMKDYRSSHFILVNDIDASATSDWNGGAGFEPIGTGAETGSASFTGHLDGQGYVITGLTINRPSTNSVGLFGTLGAGGEVKNTGLVNVNISGQYTNGGLVGKNFGTVSNSYASGSVSGSAHVGGLVGNNSGTVSNSYASSSVSGTTLALNVGGLVGNNSGTVSNSYGTGSVSGTIQVGGLVGYMSGPGNKVSNSYASGSVSGSVHVGGLVGNITNTVGNAVSNSYATGSVSGTSNVGGLVGYISGAHNPVSNSYSTGSVSGDNNVGGLVGINNNPVGNSFWDTQTSGQSISASGTGKTTAEMKTRSTFTDAGWDFNFIWSIDSSMNEGYPHINIREDNPPTATNVNISGSLVLGETLNGSYTYSDEIEGSESGTTYQWYRSDDNSGTGKTAISGATTQSYTLTENDLGKYISFRVTPSNGTDTGNAAESNLAGPVVDPNTPPSATNASISGDLMVKEELTGSYNFSDDDGDSDSGSAYQWYRSDDAGGTNKSAIGGATSQAYTLTQSDLAKYMSFRVTPNDGQDAGTPAESNLAGPVGVAACPADVNLTTQAQANEFSTVYAHCDEVTGDLIVGSDITDLSPLSNITAVGGELMIQQNTHITSLQGLENIASVGGRFVIKGNSSLANLQALESLTSVGGYLEISQNNSLTNLQEFANLGSTGGLYIWGNSSITDLQGLESLTTVSGVTQVDQNASLTSLQGVENITSIGGTLQVTNNPLLTDIEALKSIEMETVTNLLLKNNSTLDVCNLPGICEYLADPDNPREVTGNAGNCADVDAITATCSCAEPTGLSADVSSTGADLSWTAGDEETEWEVIYGQSGFNPETEGTTETVTNTPELSLSDLTPGSEYQFYVIAHCFGFCESERVGPYTFSPNTVPEATNVGFTGELRTGEELTGSYDFSDDDGDSESGSTYQWYRSSDDEGTGKAAIHDATNLTYTLTEDDEGKYISFQVTPNDGAQAGDAIESTLDGPVLEAFVFAGGTGTEVDPYKISNVTQLQAMRDYLGSHFIVINDIDASSTSTWNSNGAGGFLGFDPVGDSDTPFNGSFDGNGKKISGLYINRPTESYIGLFSQISGTSQIEHIGLEEVDIIGNTQTGALVGLNAGGEIKTSYSTGSISGSIQVGGLVGASGASGSITDSYSRCSVTTRASLTFNIGGLAGVGGNITNSYAAGSVTGSSLLPAGLSNTATAVNSFWNVDVVPDVSATETGTPKTTSELKTQSTFTDAGWDFNFTWSIDPSINDGYPYINIRANNPPVATNVNISGSLIIGETLNGSYSYSDEIEGSESGTTYQWYRSDDAGGTGKAAIDDATNLTYTLTEDDEGKYISFEVTPNDGTNEGNAVEIDFEGPIEISNTPPSATNISVSGDLIVSEELTGSYNFSDNEGDSESGSTYQWYRSDDEEGTGKAAITDATNLTYTLTEDDEGKYISFQVMPNDGTDTGEAMESDFRGQITSPFAGGEGTEAEPYQVSTAEQLNYVRNFLDKHFEQTDDINLGASPWNDGEGWVPIGTSGTPFTGTYNGGSYTISNLYIEREDSGFQGLFGYAEGADFKNIAVENAEVNGGNSTAGLVARNNNGVISNSYVSGSVSGGSYTGGLVGFSSSTITNSYVRGSVSGNLRTGGLVGQNTEGTIINSYASGSVSGSTNTGGLVADNFNGTITNSFWDKETTGQDNSDGGMGKLTAEMKTQSTYTSWDFDDTWIIDPGLNDGYPELRLFVEEVPNTVPVVSNVSISGDLTVGEELTGSYDFSDDDGDSESGSTYQWYRSDDEDGTGKIAIGGATNSTYTLTEDDEGKHISFQVTPYDGEDAGNTVESNLTGPVIGPISAAQSTFEASESSVPGDGSSTISLSVTLRDSNGNRLITGGENVFFETTGGNLSGVTDNEDGSYTVTLTSSTTTGSVTLTAYLGTDNTGDEIGTFDITFTPGAVADFLVEANGGGTINQQTAGQAFSIDITARDVNGNTVTGFTGTVDLSLNNEISFSSGGGTTTAFENGELSGYSVQINTANIGYIITATETDDTPSGTSNTFDVVAGSADALVITTQPEGAASGEALSEQPVVELRDAYDNVLTGDSSTEVTVSILSGDDGSLGGTLTQTAENGVVTFDDVTLEGLVSENYVLRFTDGTRNVDSDEVAVTVGSAESMAMNEQPATSTAGQAITGPPSVIITDGAGNPVSGIEVTVSLNENTFSSGDITITTDANGIAEFDDLVISLADTGYELEFDANATGVTDVSSNAFSVIPGAAASIALTGGTGDLSSGSDRTLTATIYDIENNVVTAGDDSVLDVEFTKTDGAGTVSGLQTVTASNGVATVDVTGQLEGSITIQAEIETTAATTLSDDLTFTITTGLGTPTITTPADESFVNANDATSRSISGMAAGATQARITITDSGTGEIEQTVTVTDDDYSQNFDVSGLADGELTIEVVGIDEAENESASASITVTLDQTPPVLAVNGQLTNDNTPSITGTSDQPEGSTVSITINEETYTGTTEVNGDWSINVTDVLTDDEYTVSVTTSDEAGNGTTETGTITVDTTVPALAINDQTTNDTTPALTGNSDEIGGTVSIAINGNTYTGTVGGDGNWSIEVADALAEGEFMAVATITDEAGNETTETGTVTIDTAAPTVAIEDAPEIVNSTDAFEVTFEFSEDVSGFVVGDINITNGSASNFTAVDGDTYTADITPDGNGDVAIDVPAGVANDEAGNGNTAASQESISYDATAPTLTVNDLQTNDTTPTITGTSDETGGTVTLTIDGTEYTATVGGDESWSVEVGILADDVYTSSAEITDEAGNETTATGTITIDAQAPTGYTVAWNTDPVNSTNETATAFTISNGEDEADYDWTITDGTDLVTGSGTFDGVTAAITGVDVSGLVDGTLTVSITLTDAVDNEGDAQIAEVEKDTEAPRLTQLIRQTPTSEFTNADALTFRATFSENVVGVSSDDFAVAGPTGVTISVNKIDGSTYDITISSGDLADFDGEVTLSLSTPDFDDEAGNELTNTSATGTVETYSLDNTAPEITSINIVGTPDEDATSIQYEVVLSENVTGFSLDGFDLTTTGNATGTIDSFTDSDDTYTITINDLDGSGTVRLDFTASDSNVEDEVGNTIVEDFEGEVHTIEIIGEIDLAHSSVSADPTNLMAGTNSTITVTLQDSNENPISTFVEADFTFDRTGDAGLVTNSFSNEGNGVYEVQLTNESAEEIMVTVSVDEDGTGSEVGTATITFTPDVVASIVLSADPSDPVAGQNTTLTATVTDQFGNLVSGEDVDFSLTSGTGSFDGVSTNITTNGSGEATATYTTDSTVETAELRAELSDDDTINDELDITSVPGTAAKYLITESATTVTASENVTITAQLADVNDNPISEQNRTVNWSATNGGSFSDDGTTQTDSGGETTVTYTVSTTAGTSHVVTASDDADGTITGDSQIITTEVGAVTQLAFVDQPEESTPAGDDIGTVSLRLEDASGNLVETDGTSITLAISGDGTLAGTVTQSTTNGIATFGDLYVEEPGTEYTLTATSDGLTPDESDAFEITRRALTLTADAASKTYGDADPDFTYELTSGDLITGVELTGDLDRAEAEDAGTYAITQGGLTNANNPSYDITFSPADLTITAKGLKLTNFVADDKTYDGTTGVTGDGFEDDRLNDDELTFDYDVVFADASAGTGKEVNFTSIEISGGDDADNYTLVTTSGTATADIDHAELTITGATADDKTYDGTTEASITGATLDGVINDDDVALDALVGSFADANAANDIEVTAALTLTGDDTGNYSLTQPTGLSAHITPLELTIAGDFTAENKIYDGDTDASLEENNLTLDAPVNGDDVSLSDIVVEFASADVANEIEVSIISAELSGTAFDNYTLSLTDSPSTTADITNASVSVTEWPTASDIIYGQSLADSDLTGGTADQPGTFAFTDETETPASAGTYSAEVTFTPDSDNYSEVTGDVDMEVDPKELTITGATADDKTYDGATDAVISGATLEGVINNDNVELDALVGSFDDANVADDIEVTAALTLTGDDTGNYTLTQPTGLTADITKSALTITVEDASRKAGAADPAFGFADFGGSLAAGDVAADVTGGAGTAGDVTFTLSTTDTDSEPGEYTDEISIDTESLDGAKSGNYDITMEAGTLTITPADLGSFLVEGIDDPTQAGTANTVQVTALDTEGNVKTDYIGTVTFSSSDEEASLPDRYTFVAGDNGAREFENEVTFETAGAHWVQAADGDVSDRQEEIDVNAGPVATDNAGTLIEVITNDITANGTDEATVRATLLDEFDNPVPGVTVSFATTGEASIGTATGTSDTNGQITATLTNTTAETVDVTAQYDSNNDTTADTDITNGSPAEVTFVAGAISGSESVVTANPTTLIADGTSVSTVSIELKDANGNPVGGQEGDITLSGLRSAAAGAVGETGTAGTYEVKITNTTAELITVSVTVDELDLDSKPTITFEAGAISASESVVTATTPHTADGTDASTITIELKDANGNAIGGIASGDFTIGLTGNATAGIISETDTLGTYEVNSTNTTAEEVTVTVNVDGLQLNNQPTITFDAGVAVEFLLSGNNAQTAGTSQDLTITARDAYGNTATAYTGDKVLIFSGASDSPNGTRPTTIDKDGNATEFGRNTSITFTNGLATVNTGDNGAMTLYAVEMAAIAVSDGAISEITTFDVDVTAGPANQMVFTQQPEDTDQGEEISPAVVLQVQDEFGNDRKEAEIDLTVTVNNEASLNGTTTLATDADGQVSFDDLVIDEPGEYILNATGTGLVDAESDEFEISDITPPTLAVDDHETNNRTPIITGTSNEIGGTVTVTIDGETYTATVQNDGTWSVEVTNELGDGEYSVTVSIKDDAGNESEAVGALNVDASGPQLAVDDQESETSTPTITGTSDAPAGAEVMVTVGGQTYKTFVDEEGTWSLDITDELEDGEYSITASVADELGNTTEATGSLVVDTVELIVEIDNQTADTSTPAITGTTNAPEGTEVTVVVNETEYTGTVSAGGTWSIGITEELADGEYIVTASITDESGDIIEGTGKVIISTVSLEHIAITADPVSIVADGESTSTITVELFNSSGERMNTSQGEIELFTELGSLNNATDNEDGTYTAILTSGTELGTALITGTLNGGAIVDTEEVRFESGAAARVAILSGNDQSQEVTTLLEQPLVVAVYDANENPIAGIDISFEIVGTPESAEDQAISENTITTNANGEASIEFTLGTKSGEYQIEAKMNGVEPVRFTQTAFAGALVTFEIIGGDMQEQPTLSTLNQLLAVQMLDEFRNPIVEQEVEFIVEDSPEFSRGSEFDPQIAISDENGEARTSFRLGDVGGDYKIGAYAVGQGFEPLIFTTTAVEKRPNPTIIDTVNTVVFNGGTNTFMYVDPSASLDDMESFTSEIWVLPDSLTEYYELFNKAVAQEGRQFIIWGEGNQVFATIYLEDGSEVTVNAENIFSQIPTTPTETNKSASLNNDSAYVWTHLALSVDDQNKTIDMYKNGFRIAQANFEGDVNQGTSQLQMGRGFDGEIHEVRVWGTAISKAGIQSRMTQILSGTEENLILYNTFDDDGEVAEDLTRNGNDLKLGSDVRREFSVRGIPNIEMNENEEYIMAFTDVDEFGDELKTIITELPKNGMLYQIENESMQGQQITSVPITLTDERNRALYIPDQNYFGSDSLGYTLQDIFENRSEAVREITIYSVYRSPSAFDQLYPTQNDSVTVEFRGNDQTVNFIWERSLSYTNTQTEYILSVWDENEQEEVYTGIFDTTYTVNMKESILDYDKRYTWSIDATDGVDTTRSLNELSFLIMRERPLIYQLHQNYPNPFNPSTNIEYGLPVTAQVRVEIFDVLGRRVQVIVDRQQVNPGTYQVQWGANNLASGVYYYRMTAEDVNGSRFVKMKKMMLIK